MKNIKKFICLLIMTVLITPSIAIAEDTYSGYFNNDEITMFADTSVKISENEKSAVEDIISDLNNLKRNLIFKNTTFLWVTFKNLLILYLKQYNMSILNYFMSIYVNFLINQQTVRQFRK